MLQRYFFVVERCFYEFLLWFYLFVNNCLLVFCVFK